MNFRLIDLFRDSETDSVMSEDDGGRKEEMKKSIFMKRKSSESSVSPRSNEKSPERKNYNNPFNFSHAKKATNDIIQNEILKNEIMKRNNEDRIKRLKKFSRVINPLFCIGFVIVFWAAGMHHYHQEL